MDNFPRCYSVHSGLIEPPDRWLIKIFAHVVQKMEWTDESALAQKKKKKGEMFMIQLSRFS
jgi:hypothetical protein